MVGYATQLGEKTGKLRPRPVDKPTLAQPFSTSTKLPRSSGMRRSVGVTFFCESGIFSVVTEERGRILDEEKEARVCRP